MDNSHSIAELDARGLRHFGISTGAIVALLFGIVLPWFLDFQFPLWPWYIFVALLLPALACPKALAPVYKYWMKFGLLISRVTTPIILGILFFLIFLPMGLVMKLLNKDPMHRKLSAEQKSYRVMRKKIDPKTMENPF